MLAGRTVTVVLVDSSGDVLGSLPPFEVQLPYWQDTTEIVAGVDDSYGLTVDVLRLLHTDHPAPHGGAVTYLAEISGAPGATDSPFQPTDPQAYGLAVIEEPLRLPYARPGGPAASVAWALDHSPIGTTAVQQRTWNLSAIWRVEGPFGAAWLKQVPPFFGHEEAALRWVDTAVPGAVPALLGADSDRRRMLLAEAPGTELYGSTVQVRARILALAHAIQLESVDAADRLVDEGVPDLRGPRLAAWAADELHGHLGSHPAAALVAGLQDQLAEIEACGLPAVLVHGDLHPGNAIGDEDHLALIDWGDCFVGHPGFDALRLTADLPPADAEPLLARWAEAWRRAVPGCRPERALQLLPVIECLRSAAVYAGFLARIEPTERAYHRADVPACLDRAVALATAGQAVRE